MRPIGGEIELKKDNYTTSFTDSGRSSLRLFLRSEDYNNKKFLIPDFLCDIIEKVFIEERINYSYYTVNSELSIDSNYINKSDYDVLYIINYFGQILNLEDVFLKDKILIEDNVFLYDFDNHLNHKKWYAFNSLRKISSLSSGSLIKTNMRINESLILNEDSVFSEKKIEAKNIKFEFIKNKQFNEKTYLDKFLEGELILDNQKNIYKMNSSSLGKIFSFNINNEQSKRKKRFNILYNLLGNDCINIRPLFYSFFVFKIKNRNDFRNILMENKIFLPIHWPKENHKNILYSNLISIPLFEIYTDIEFNNMMSIIKKIIIKKVKND